MKRIDAIAKHRPFGASNGHGLGRRAGSQFKGYGDKAERQRLTLQRDELRRAVERSEADRADLMRRFRRMQLEGQGETQLRQLEETTKTRAAELAVAQKEAARVRDACSDLARLYIAIRSEAEGGAGAEVETCVSDDSSATHVLEKCAGRPLLLCELIRAAVHHVREQRDARAAAAAREQEQTSERRISIVREQSDAIAKVRADIDALQAKLNAREALLGRRRQRRQSRARAATKAQQREQVRLRLRHSTAEKSCVRLRRRIKVAQDTLEEWREEWLPRIPALEAQVGASRRAIRRELHDQAVRHCKAMKDVRSDVTAHEKAEAELRRLSQELHETEAEVRAAAASLRDQAQKLPQQQDALRDARARGEELRRLLAREEDRTRNMRFGATRAEEAMERASRRRQELRKEEEDAAVADASTAREAEKAAADAADGRDELGEDGEPIPATMTAWRGKLRKREAETALLRGSVRTMLGEQVVHIRAARARQRQLEDTKKRREALEEELRAMRAWGEASFGGDTSSAQAAENNDGAHADNAAVPPKNRCAQPLRPRTNNDLNAKRACSAGSDADARIDTKPKMITGTTLKQRAPAWPPRQ